MKLFSPAFQDNQPIPRKYTCDGQDVSPPLIFAHIPINTKTFALIVDDPDAPMGTFDHWIAWNIPVSQRWLEEGATVPMEGINDFGTISYRGPCPPEGPVHHYFFKLYALDSGLTLPSGSTKEQVQEAMQGHILQESLLIGTYQR